MNCRHSWRCYSPGWECWMSGRQFGRAPPEDHVVPYHPHFGWYECNPKDSAFFNLTDIPHHKNLAISNTFPSETLKESTTRDLKRKSLCSSPKERTQLTWTFYEHDARVIDCNGLIRAQFDREQINKTTAQIDNEVLYSWTPKCEMATSCCAWMSLWVTTYDFTLPPTDVKVLITTTFQTLEYLESPMSWGFSQKTSPLTTLPSSSLVANVNLFWRVFVSAGRHMQ